MEAAADVVARAQRHRAQRRSTISTDCGAPARMLAQEEEQLRRAGTSARPEAAVARIERVAELLDRLLGRPRRAAPATAPTAPSTGAARSAPQPTDDLARSAFQTRATSCRMSTNPTAPLR
jgi:hypothetical protein